MRIQLSRAVAWPFLLPGDFACRKLHIGDYSNLVRMLINSLVWTVIGVIVVALVV